MEMLKPEGDLDLFFKRLSKVQHRALLLDYDGTLAPFHLHRDQAFPYPGVMEILDAIMEAGYTRVVLVSGRWTQDLLPLLGLKQLPEISFVLGDLCVVVCDACPKITGSGMCKNTDKFTLS